MLAITNDPVIAGVVLLLAEALSTWAGPPFFTDDPDVVEYRHWQFYLATQEVKHQKDGWSGTAPHQVRHLNEARPPSAVVLWMSSA